MRKWTQISPMQECKSTLTTASGTSNSDAKWKVADGSFWVGIEPSAEVGTPPGESLGMEERYEDDDG